MTHLGSVVVILRPMTQDALRIIDANLNRAREGLRTAEDYARFILNDATSQQTLKTLRRSLGEVITALGPQAEGLLDSRDVQADVGTDPAAQAARSDLRAVAQAGLKRAQEALRVIEEYSQLLSPKAAAAAASVRYALYLAEPQLFSGGPLRAKVAAQPVLVIFTRELCALPWRETLALLLTAGADFFQLREKRVSVREYARYAADFVEAARERGGLTIINDRADIAFSARADGVHLGRDDLPLPDARRMLGPGAIIGASTHSLKEALDAAEAGADYLGVGTMYESTTKADVERLVGPALLEQVLPRINLPAFAIGGIKADNVARLANSGARQVAVCSAIIRSKEPAQAYHEIAAALKAAAQPVAGEASKPG